MPIEITDASRVKRWTRKQCVLLGGVHRELYPSKESSGIVWYQFSDYQ